MPTLEQLIASVNRPQRRRAGGLVPKHNYPELPQDPIQDGSWLAGLDHAGICEYIRDWRSRFEWSYLALPVEDRREMPPAGVPWTPFDTFAEPIYDPQHPDADRNGYRPADWRHDYYPDETFTGLLHGWHAG